MITVTFPGNNHVYWKYEGASWVQPSYMERFQFWGHIYSWLEDHGFEYDICDVHSDYIHAKIDDAEARFLIKMTWDPYLEDVQDDPPF